MLLVKSMIFCGAGIDHDIGHNKSNSHSIDNLINHDFEDFKHGFTIHKLVDFVRLWTPSWSTWIPWLLTGDQRLPPNHCRYAWRWSLDDYCRPRKWSNMQVQTILVNIFLSWLILHRSEKWTYFPMVISTSQATVASFVVKAMIGESFLDNLSKWSAMHFGSWDKRWWSSQGSHGEFVVS